MVLGLFKRLRETNTKFIVVDLIGAESDLSKIKTPGAISDTNVMNVIKVEPYITIPPGFSKKYPNPTDDFHFNEEGQRVVAEMLLPTIKTLLEI